eukprot:COSAG01_NODE_1431_length_10324_cov_23.953154_6_plen_79_part_00
MGASSQQDCHAAAGSSPSVRQRRRLAERALHAPALTTESATFGWPGAGGAMAGRRPAPSSHMMALRRMSEAQGTAQMP